MIKYIPHFSFKFPTCFLISHSGIFKTGKNRKYKTVLAIKNTSDQINKNQSYSDQILV